MKTIIENLEFTPLHRYMSAGNEIQICKTNYLGIGITERTFFPYNIFKKPSYWYTVDLVLKTSEYNCLSEDYYTQEGYGLPEFKTLEEACEFIINYKKRN